MRILPDNLQLAFIALHEEINPMTRLKSHGAEVVKEFSTNPELIISMQNGEANIVVVESIGIIDSANRKLPA